MIKRAFILMLLLAAASCSKNETGVDQTENSKNNELQFTVNDLIADWTRGTSINSKDDIADFAVFGVRKFGTADRSLYVNGVTATKDENSIWSFEHALFYPYGESLKFWALSPAVSTTSQDDNVNGVSYSFDLDNEKLAIDYIVPAVDARNQPDIIVATEQEGSSSPLELKFKHLLTKITLSAKLAATATDNDRYVVTKLSMENIVRKGSITAPYSGWEIDNTIFGEVTASTGHTIAKPDNANAVFLNNSAYQNIMVDSEGGDQALFMIPQPIEASQVGFTPTILVTVYDKLDDIYYRTKAMALPTPNKAGWLMGQHINLQLEFDPNDEDLVIPMSILPTMRQWEDHIVDTNIDANIKLWCDTYKISAANSQIVKLYSNSSNTPTVSFSNTSVTATVGAKTGDYFPLTIDGSALSAGDEVTMSVEIENSDSKKITKEFKFTIE